MYQQKKAKYMNGNYKYWLLAGLWHIALFAQAADGKGWRLSGDSLLVTQGTTYRYTVDTPEGEGLTVTTPTVGTIVSGLVSEAGSTFQMVGRDGNTKDADSFPADGDRLHELSRGGKRVKE